MEGAAWANWPKGGARGAVGPAKGGPRRGREKGNRKKRKRKIEKGFSPFRNPIFLDECNLYF
jgi:hypothetical protein